MLKRLKINRFKSIYGADLEFGSVNLFVGPNGSGKSNILEAIGIIAAIFSRGIDPNELDLKGIRLSLPHIFKSAFKGHDLPKTFQIEATFESGKYTCGIRSSSESTYLEFFSESLFENGKQIYGRSMHGIRFHSDPFLNEEVKKDSVLSNRSVWGYFNPFLTISDEFRKELEQFSAYAIYSPQTAVMRGLAIDNRVVEPLGLTGSGLASAFEQALLAERAENFHEIVKIIWEPGWTDQLQVGPFDASIVPDQVRSEGKLLYLRDKYMKGGRNYLSTFDASEGTLYLIFVATLLAHPSTPNVFALDNVDGTLNPNLVRLLTNHIVKMCIGTENRSRRQVFMTSHHPSSLDSFDIFSSSQRIFISSRLKSGDKEETELDGALVTGSTNFRRLRPPKGMSQDDWNIKHRGKNLSELLLSKRIRDAL